MSRESLQAHIEQAANNLEAVSQRAARGEVGEVTLGEAGLRPEHLVGAAQLHASRLGARDLQVFVGHGRNTRRPRGSRRANRHPRVRSGGPEAAEQHADAGAEHQLPVTPAVGAADDVAQELADEGREHPTRHLVQRHVDVDRETTAREQADLWTALGRLADHGVTVIATTSELAALPGDLLRIEMEPTHAR